MPTTSRSRSKKNSSSKRSKRVHRKQKVNKTKKTKKSVRKMRGGGGAPVKMKDLIPDNLYIKADLDPNEQEQMIYLGRDVNTFSKAYGKWRNAKFAPDMEPDNLISKYKFKYANPLDGTNDDMNNTLTEDYNSGQIIFAPV